MDASRNKMWFTVAVAALGYFVDLYDIVIFGVVRVASLNELGLTGADNTMWGIRLINLQMIGMLIGGVLWGVIGDKLGRRTALLATILMYSLANIANAYVTNVEQYAVLRFIAGIGLAGELGAGITLVTEALPANRRGYGATVVAFLGLLGALTASYVGALLDWRTAYLVGGLLGLVVLAGRWFGMEESKMFSGHAAGAARGDLGLLFGPRLLPRFLAVIAVGVPIWYVSALFVNLAPEMGRAMGVTGELKVADVLRWQAVGIAIGSAVTGLLSERLHSRRIVVFGALGLMAALILGMGLIPGLTAGGYCVALFFIGLGQGYWTPFITLAAEQFGTNIRATVATSVPNFVRAMTVPVTLGFAALAPLLGGAGAVFAIGALVFGLAFLALWKLSETYGRDLDYVER